MLNRVVSLSSLLLVVVSVFFFLAGAWGIMSGRIGQGDGVFLLTGWMLAGIVFSFRHNDPKWLEPISILKSR
jgi:hypothetical protein